MRGLSTVPTLPSAEERDAEAELFCPFDMVRADELRLRAAAFWIPQCSACGGILAKVQPTGFKNRWISKPINQIQDYRYNRETKRVYLLFCLNFFFLQAHGLTVLMKPPPDERDTAGAELFWPLNIFRVVELGLGAATSGTLSSKSSTCVGFPRELEQTDAFKIPTSNPTFHIEASSHRHQDEGVGWKFTCWYLSVWEETLVYWGCYKTANALQHHGFQNLSQRAVLRHDNDPQHTSKVNICLAKAAEG